MKIKPWWFYFHIPLNSKSKDYRRLIKVQESKKKRDITECTFYNDSPLFNVTVCNELLASLDFDRRLRPRVTGNVQIQRGNVV